MSWPAPCYPVVGTTVACTMSLDANIVRPDTSSVASPIAGKAASSAPKGAETSRPFADYLDDARADKPIEKEKPSTPARNPDPTSSPVTASQDRRPADRADPDQQSGTAPTSNDPAHAEQASLSPFGSAPSDAPPSADAPASATANALAAPTASAAAAPLEGLGGEEVNQQTTAPSGPAAQTSSLPAPSGDSANASAPTDRSAASSNPTQQSVLTGATANAVAADAHRSEGAEQEAQPVETTDGASDTAEIAPLASQASLPAAPQTDRAGERALPASVRSDQTLAEPAKPGSATGQSSAHAGKTGSDSAFTSQGETGNQSQTGGNRDNASAMLASTRSALAQDAQAPLLVSSEKGAAPLDFSHELETAFLGRESATAQHSSSTLAPSAISASAPRAAALAASLPSQIAVQVSKAAESGANRFVIQLDPADLGHVEVKMTVSDRGHISAVLIADRQDTLDLLQRDQRALEKALQDSGLSTDSGSLQFSLKEQNSGQSENAAKEGIARSLAGDPDVEATQPSLTPAYRAMPTDRLLDIRI